MIIVCGGIKGGTGKTTIACNLTSLEPNLEAPPFGRGGKVRPAVGRHVLC